MTILKKIPIKYIGELHDIRLVNFSVDMEELITHVPSLIKIRNLNGCALISMVDVKLQKMHPSFLPAFFSFDYRHIAFRLLIDDARYNNGENKGIYFYKSFTDQSLIVTGGSWLTDYNLELATITEALGETTLRQDKNTLKYKLGPEISVPSEKLRMLQKNVAAIDRAYSVGDHQLRVTQIQREKWPIRPVELENFENTFFASAKFEGAFRVFETIHYKWLPAKPIQS